MRHVIQRSPPGAPLAFGLLAVPISHGRDRILRFNTPPISLRGGAVAYIFEKKALPENKQDWRPVDTLVRNAGTLATAKKLVSRFRASVATNVLGHLLITALLCLSLSAKRLARRGLPGGAAPR